MPPFTVQYLCPVQGPMWQGSGQFQDLTQAELMAHVVRPNSPWGQSRVLDALGRLVFWLPPEGVATE